RRMARRGSCFVGNLHTTVPGGRLQTVVAPEDAISDERSKLQRDGTLQFNCQVRNTASRIESMRGCNRTSRTRFDATFTRSTAIGDWLIRWKFERSQNLREIEPGTKEFIDLICVISMYDGTKLCYMLLIMCYFVIRC